MSTWPGAAHAQISEIWVSVDGDDDNDGREDTPFATLQHAANQVGPGSVVRVSPGRYAGLLIDSEPARAGVRDNPVTWLADGGPGEVIVDRPGPDNYDRGGRKNHFDLTRTHYWTVDGFTFESPARAGVGLLGSADDPSVGVTFRNVVVTDPGVWGIFTAQTTDFTAAYNDCSGAVEQHGIYVSNTSNGAVVRGNHLWNNAGAGLHMNGDVSQGGEGYVIDALVEYNVVHGNGASGGSGLNCDGCVRGVFRNNILYGNRASGISVYTENAAGPSRDNTLVHNTIVQPADSRWNINIANGATGTVVFNNLLYHAPSFRGVITACETCQDGLVSDYNLFNPRFTLDGDATILDLAGWRAAGHGEHSIAIDSLAAALVDGDRRTQDGSPAIDGGAGSLAGRPAPELDFDENPRPGGVSWDIGAIEVDWVTARAGEGEGEGDGDDEHGDGDGGDDGGQGGQVDEGGGGVRPGGEGDDAGPGGAAGDAGPGESEGGEVVDPGDGDGLGGDGPAGDGAGGGRAGHETGNACVCSWAVGAHTDRPWFIRR